MLLARRIILLTPRAHAHRVESIAEHGKVDFCECAVEAVERLLRDCCWRRARGGFYPRSHPTRSFDSARFCRCARRPVPPPPTWPMPDRRRSPHFCGPPSGSVPSRHAACACPSKLLRGTVLAPARVRLTVLLWLARCTVSGLSRSCRTHMCSSSRNPGLSRLEAGAAAHSSERCRASCVGPVLSVRD